MSRKDKEVMNQLFTVTVANVALPKGTRRQKPEGVGHPCPALTAVWPKTNSQNLAGDYVIRKALGSSCWHCRKRLLKAC